MNLESIGPGCERKSGYAVVVLAAGSAKRAGRPIPLLSYLGQSLVERGVRAALASGAREVVVVAGEYVEAIRHKLSRLPVRVVHNANWQEGLAGSIRVGISALRSDPAAAVICLCDQVKTSPELLRDLSDRVLSSEGIQIAASAYNGVIGAPAAFDRSLFPALLELKGDAGARDLIRKAGSILETVCFAEAAEEIEPSECPDAPKWRDKLSVLPNQASKARTARAPPSLRKHLLTI